MISHKVEDYTVTFHNDISKSTFSVCVHKSSLHYAHGIYVVSFSCWHAMIWSNGCVMQHILSVEESGWWYVYILTKDSQNYTRHLCIQVIISSLWRMNISSTYTSQIKECLIVSMLLSLTFDILTRYLMMTW